MTDLSCFCSAARSQSCLGMQLSARSLHMLASMHPLSSPMLCTRSSNHINEPVHVLLSRRLPGPVLRQHWVLHQSNSSRQATPLPLGSLRPSHAQEQTFLPSCAFWKGHASWSHESASPTPSRSPTFGRAMCGSNTQSCLHQNCSKRDSIPCRWASGPSLPRSGGMSSMLPAQECLCRVSGEPPQ